jgi:hypothetical protein
MESEVSETRFIKMKVLISDIDSSELMSLTSSSSLPKNLNATVGTAFYNEGKSWVGLPSKEIIVLIEKALLERSLRVLEQKVEFYIILTDKSGLNRWDGFGSSLKYFFNHFEMKTARVLSK